MPRTKYMLTIDGKPAIFIGGQICYAPSKYRGAGVKESDLCESTREVQRLIRKTEDFRKAQGWEALGYGYIPIKLGM